MQDMASTRQVTFTGNAREWFGIWIVNLLLTIVTLGIYSAWAKVRRNKYFYQNTYVAGRNLDYHATGMQILIGRIIVVVGFIAYSVLSAIPIVGLVMILLLLAIFPWLLVRSLRFNAQMTSWSNVRFQFVGTMGKAFLVYIIFPILTAMTLYIAFPFFDRARKRYSINNHRLGQHKFHFDAPIGGFYIAFFLTLAWIAAVTVVLGVIAAPSLESFATPEPDVSVIGLIYLWAFLAFFPAATFYGAMIRNLTLSNLALEGGHKFHSDVAPLQVLWIALSNTVVVLCSVGFMLPWAQIRMARYLAEHTDVAVNGSLDEFVSQAQARAGAIGDAYGDIEGFDIGLPV